MIYGESNQLKKEIHYHNSQENSKVDSYRKQVEFGQKKRIKP